MKGVGRGERERAEFSCPTPALSSPAVVSSPGSEAEVVTRLRHLRILVPSLILALVQEQRLKNQEMVCLLEVYRDEMPK